MGKNDSQLDDLAGKERRRGLRAVVATLVVLAVLVGAGAVAASTAPVWAGMPIADVLSPTPKERPALSAPMAKSVSLDGLPADDAKGVNPGDPLKVSAVGGQVLGVKLVDATGSAVQGDISANKTSWTNTKDLQFDKKYTLQAQILDAAGRTQDVSRTFSTVAPANEANAWMYPMPGATVGVGQPIEIRFSEPVLNKAQVLKGITVKESSGQPIRARWIDDTHLRFRAEDFWQANSTISVDLKLFGVDFGNGQIGNFDDSWQVKIGQRKVAIADASTHQMQMWVDGKVVRTWPVTMGDAEWPSGGGINVVMDQYKSLPFDARSIGLKPGDPKWYEPFNATNASRLSNTGEFVHQTLPGGMSSLGVTNISHGCIGMSVEGAAWFMDNWTRGDVVEVRNSAAGPLPLSAGYGDLNIPWDQYANTPASK